MGGSFRLARHRELIESQHTPSMSALSGIRRRNVRFWVYAKVEGVAPVAREAVIPTRRPARPGPLAGLAWPACLA
jgi:hypothetical protein